jgi:serine/threonine protein phosphatase 1
MDKKRIFALGDPHGGFKAVKQCLERSGFDKENDTLILLGDTADGWPEVPECIEEFLTIKNLINIRGNHDSWADQWLQYRIANPMWLHQGGQATYDAYTIYHPDLMEKHQIEFFAKQVSYYIDDKNRGFVHGGFVSRKGLGHDATHTNYMWDRDLWSLAMMSKDITHYDEDGLPSAQRFFKHEELFIGHTTTGMWKVKPTFPEYHDPNQAKNGRITVPMHRCNVWNLDTGGGFEGKLTIMDVDTKEYWQSDFVKDLYPNVKGR